MDNSIEFALTLTTGVVPTKLGIDKYNRLLNNLLCKYFDIFIDYQVNLEILDKNYVETKLHFHGYMNVRSNRIYNYNRFLDDWKTSKGHIKNLVITDKEKWLQYINKQKTILELSYSHMIEKIVHTPTNIKVAPKSTFDEFLQKSIEHQKKMRGIKGALE